MKTSLCVAFLIYFLTFNIDPASTLRCYSCSSQVGYKYDCEVKVNNKTVATQNCTTGYTACMSLRVNSTITRACGVNNVCQIYSNTTGFRSCSTCVTDLCNSKNESTASYFSLLLGLLSVFLPVAHMTVH